MEDLMIEFKISEEKLKNEMESI